MDLGKYDVVKAAGEGSELQLRDPVTGEPLPIFITLYGRDSEAYRNKYRELNRLRITKMTRAGRNGAVTQEDLEADGRKLVAACTSAWRDEDHGDRPANVLLAGDKQYPFSPDAVIELYTDFPWTFEQADAFLNDRANFLKG